MLLANVTVRSVERFSPSFVRFELGGAELEDFGVDGPLYDQRFKLVLPTRAGLPRLNPSSWWVDLQALPDDARPAVRTYTVREVRGTGADTRIVLDVVLHPGAQGPGSAWAQTARVGDEVAVVVPRRGTPFGGIEWDPQGADRLLLVGDETAVPAVASILGSLPTGARGAAYLEVPTTADLLDLTAPPGVSITWLPRCGAPVGCRVVEAVAEHLGFAADPTLDDVDDVDDVVDPGLWETPAYSSSGERLHSGDPACDRSYAWIAGESGMVTTLRRHLVRDLGWPRSQVAFMGYWRQGTPMRS